MPFSSHPRLLGSVLLLAWSLLCAGCANRSSEPAASQSVDASSGRARFIGPIDWDSVHRLQSLMKGKSIRILEVDSRGGNTEAAIAPTTHQALLSGQRGEAKNTSKIGNRKKRFHEGRMKRTSKSAARAGKAAKNRPIAAKTAQRKALARIGTPDRTARRTRDPPAPRRRREAGPHYGLVVPEPDASRKRLAASMIVFT